MVKLEKLKGNLSEPKVLTNQIDWALFESEVNGQKIIYRISILIYIIGIQLNQEMEIYLIELDYTLQAINKEISYAATTSIEDIKKSPGNYSFWNKFNTITWDI